MATDEIGELTQTNYVYWLGITIWLFIIAMV